MHRNAPGIAIRAHAPCPSAPRAARSHLTSLRAARAPLTVSANRAAVFLFPLVYLPFAELVPWANMSVSLRAEDFAKFAVAPRSMPNPLFALVHLARDEPARVRAMQLALAEARWLLHYRSEPMLAGGPRNATDRPSAAQALAHHLVLAAKQRVRALRAGLDSGACGVETLGDIAVF